MVMKSMTALKTALVDNGEINNPKIIHLCVQGMCERTCMHICACVY